MTDRVKKLGRNGVPFSAIFLADPYGDCSCRPTLTMNHIPYQAKRRVPGPFDPPSVGYHLESAIWSLAAPYQFHVSQLDSDAFKKACTKPCVCGSSIQRCESATHLAVLDAMAATLHVKGDIKQAFKTSLCMLYVAVGKPEVWFVNPCTRYSPNKTMAGISALCKDCSYSPALFRASKWHITRLFWTVSL